MDYKQEFQLTTEQMAELHLTARTPGWAILLTCFRKLERLALDELASFRTGDQSFELRGKVTGVRRGKELVDEVYKNTHSTALENDKQTEESNNAAGESRIVGIAA